MSDPFLAHILAQTRQNIEFLAARDIIPRSDADVVLAKLPSASDASVLALSQRTQDLVISGGSAARRNVPPPSRTTRAKALWDYNENGETPDDLSFRAGDIIEIISETNPDWWTGRHHGRQGLFPSTYVQKLDSATSPSPPAFPARSPQPPDTRQYNSGPGYRASYGPPPGPPIGYASPPPPAPYNPYMGPPMQPSPAVPVAQVQQAPPPAAPRPSRFGGLGNTLATSAVGGLGFGAGSAIGSDLINSIF